METKKRKRTRRRAGGLSGTSYPSRLTLKKVTNEAKTPALILGGMFLGAQVGKLIDKQVTPSVAGLLGLDGAASKFIKPAIVGAGGLVVAAMTRNPNVRLVGYGVSASGGVMLAKAMNVNLLPLSGVEDEGYNARTPIPGVGDPNLPALEEPVNGDPEFPIAGDGDEPVAGAEDFPIAGDDDDQPIA